MNHKKIYPNINEDNRKQNPPTLKDENKSDKKIYFKDSKIRKLQQELL